MLVKVVRMHGEERQDVSSPTSTKVAIIIGVEVTLMQEQYE
jgi:hypothetical protein